LYGLVSDQLLALYIPDKPRIFTNRRNKQTQLQLNVLQQKYKLLKVIFVPEQNYYYLILKA